MTNNIIRTVKAWRTEMGDGDGEMNKDGGDGDEGKIVVSNARREETGKQD